MNILKKIHRFLLIKYADWITSFSLRKKAGILFYIYFNKKLNWKNPTDINEKINWLKFYSDTSHWTELADKIRVRDFVKSKGWEDILIPVWGQWNNVNLIDWDKLPEPFVLKTNNASGDVIMCHDKSKLSITEINERLNVLMNTKFGKRFAEPHYDKIIPTIYAEKMLDINRQAFKSSSLIDYKIWTFNGKPEYVFLCFNRTKDTLNVALFDIEWNPHPELLNKTKHIVPEFNNVNKPHNLEKMLKIAGDLSVGFPQMRVDLYEVEGKVYFGEITLTSAAGFMDYFTQDALKILGQHCDLNIAKTHTH